MRKEKRVVKEFYNTFGWLRDADGIYKDTSTFVDLRPVLDSYRHRTHLRVKDFLKPHGEYFLDAGSGAIPHPEYLEYSAGYKWRVCVDLSERALIEAKSKLQEQGICVLADITKLPFKDGIFDATVCAHVLYHIPQDEQESAIHELYRTLKCGSSCTIIYAWPTSLLSKIAIYLSARQLTATIRRLISTIPGTRLLWRKIMKPALRIPDKPIPDNERHDMLGHPPLYAHFHSYEWFEKSLPHDWHVDIRCWRSVDRIFTTKFVHENLSGLFLVKLMSWLETIFPHTLARIGRYPIIIIQKD